MIRTVIILCMLFSGNLLAEDQDDSIPASNLQGIDEQFHNEINELMKYHHVPGASIALVSDRKILWSRAYGVVNAASKEAVMEDTLFQAASISKPVTAMAVLKLAEKGYLDIDAPAESYLSNWQLPAYSYSEKSPVLVKQLINHTAGLTVHGFEGYKPDEEVPTLNQVLNGANWFQRLFGLTTANSGQVKVATNPGTEFDYSGGGYSVLQRLLIDTQEKDFVELMNNEVLTPLDMLNSTYEQPVTGKFTKLTASGHRSGFKPVKGNYHIYPEQAAAGLWTNSIGLAKFAIDIQNSLQNDTGKVLSKQSAELMTSATIDSSIGLGFFLLGASSNEQGYFGHDGWNEGFSSSLLAHKSNGYGIVILTNANQPMFNNEVIDKVMKKYNWVAIN